MFAIKNSFVQKLFTVCAISFLALLLYASPITAAENNTAQNAASISVYGVGKVEVIPDKISFVVGIDAKAPTAEQAYRIVEQKTAKALKTLKSLDVAERDIQAMHLTLNPVIDYKQRDRIIAHDARRDIHVSVDDIERYARAIEAMADLEITRFQQVTLASSENEQLKLKALELAYIHAEEKAKRLAVLAGKTLRGAIDIIEEGNISSSRPVPFARSAMLAEADTGAASVSTGLISIQSRVAVTFAVE